MAEKFDEFMEEVESDIRHEKYMNLWNRYGKALTGFIIMGLACLVGYNLWNQYDYNKRSKASDVLISAQDYAAQDRHGEALSVLKSLATSTVAPYDILAKVNEAGILSLGDARQKQEALKLYQDILNTKNIDSVWHDLATYQKVVIQSEQSEVNFETLLKELDAIDQEHSSLAPLVLELKGALLFQKGDKAQAGEIFVKLAQSKTAPEGVVMRSQLMAQIISAN
ncbi:tetratricopeptide repeat protein [Candidatus Paracaedibacter symbiosus]|uniref:tetratricopeptide repeat protein n=1 Tax=Candidatus Paracaedibacter symbiosus TaxID=244582 RepID=UPI000509E17A|nr:tetratricopeptide repeat protein [Candidatus Paracaedibacter symbiosus]